MPNSAENQNNVSCKISPIANVYFTIGLIATISIRAIGITDIFNEILTKILWYIGVVGFLLFFMYKFKIEKRRREIILKNNIIEKITNSEFSEKDKLILSDIMCALLSKNDSVNYFVIFFTSLIALLIALVFDLKITG